MTRCAKGLTIALLAMGVAACGTGPKRGPAPEPADDMVPAEPIDRGPSPEGDAPETVESRYDEAIGFLRSGRNDAARRALESLMQELPEASGPPTNLGILQAREGRHAQARALLEEAIRRNPDNLVARNWLAHSHRENRRPESAEQVWLRALERAPDYTAAHINLGRLYEEVLADLPAAIRHYRAAFESSNGEALRVLPWIAQLEERLQDGRQSNDAPAGADAQNAPDTASANEEP